MMSGGTMIQGRVQRTLIVLFAIFSITAQGKGTRDIRSVPGEFVVKLRPTMMPMMANRLEKSLNMKVKRMISAEQRLALVQRPVIENEESSLKVLATNPLIEIAEPNYIYSVNGAATQMPSDTQIAQLWGLKNIGQTIDGDAGKFTGRPGVDIDAEKAWSIETGSQQIVVAVIDTGLNYNLPIFSGNIYTNKAELDGQTGVDDDDNGCIDDIHGCDFAAKDGDPMDVYGHGTHVSGTIGANGANGTDIVGVAWNVTLLPIRFLDDQGKGTLDNAIASIDYATKMKANIISASWGGGGFSQLLMEAITRSRDAGILFIAAAGNDANNNDSSPTYPASFQIDNIISVAAIDPAGNIADFSNIGKSSVHIAAPGVDITSHTMKGQESWSGTSMAAPHVTGVAALLLSQDLTQSYMTVKNRLLSSARPMGTLRNRVSTGMLNAYLALTDGVAPQDPDDPFNWMKINQVISSFHPYKEKTLQEWRLEVPGAKRISVYFTNFDTEARYDKVEFLDDNGKVLATMSGHLGEVYGPAINADHVRVKFTSDDSANFEGFDIGGIAYE
jgi:subtilisin family serine protease